MNPNTRYINENYDVVYASRPVKYNDYSMVDEFLLGEDPQNIGERDLNRLFLNTFLNTEKDVLLVPKVPSMHKIAKELVIQSVGIVGDPRIMGWDIGFPGIFLDEAEYVANLELKAEISQKELLNPEITPEKAIAEKAKFKELYEKMYGIGKKSFISKLKRVREAEIESFAVRAISLKESLIKAREIARYTFLIADIVHLKETEEINKFGPLKIIRHNPDLSLDNNPNLPPEFFTKFIVERNLIILTPQPYKAEQLRKIRLDHMKKMY